MAYSKVDLGTCLPNELRMVLVGKTGVGKSATGNTIIGRSIFHATSRSTGTEATREHTFQRKGQNLQVIDVPGFVDKKLSQEKIQNEIGKCVFLSHPGLHAILFVVEAGRYKEEDTRTLEQFCECFGEESQNYVIVIFTKVDALKRDNLSLADYIQTLPDNVKEFLKNIKYRYVGINNWSDDKAELEMAVNNLLERIRQLVECNNGEYYTNEMYQAAEETRRERIKVEMDRLASEEREKDEKLLKETRKKYEQELQEYTRIQKKTESELKALEDEKEQQANLEREREIQFQQERERYQRQLEEQNVAENVMKEKLEARMKKLNLRAKTDKEDSDRKLKKKTEELEQLRHAMRKLETKMNQSLMEKGREIDEEKRVRVILMQREEAGGKGWGKKEELLHFLGSTACGFIGRAVGQAYGGSVGAASGQVAGQAIGGQATSFIINKFLNHSSKDKQN